ncbi:hypothetical protein EV356DRAFT_566491 [Viridothelium virens]|uniref:Myb-like domain-containing protein n=1 Tax=Viridothelium virens TaxID=1048519 RepID=A0A6A6HCX7_VIRVR|nr:hypothetical protein EV356DRAFT_566491 [Viridothelium virens]
MSLEPRIPLLLDDASNLSRGSANWSPHRYLQSADIVSQTSSGGNQARPGKAGVSLAQVLNTDKQPRTPAEDPSDFARTSAKRQRFEDGSSSNFLRLPKPEVKKKREKRSRIPPLIQGLHQPPPDAGLFPPITADSKHETHAPNLRQEAETDPRTEEEKESEHDTPVKASEVIQEQTSPEERQARQPRKKNKWTKEETTDLLKGVAKFGMGNWKAILSHEDYSFNGRSAIDLKDRFRTCCPEAYNQYKASGSKRQRSKDHASSDQTSGIADSPNQKDKCDVRGELPSPKPKSSRSHRMKPEDLAELGIEGPFTKKKRRERRVWTEAEDAALLKGLNEHGVQWAQISKDEKLGLTHRQPTDLRDRVRNRWPEKYVEAGLTIRPKEIPRPVQRAGKAPKTAKVDPSSSPRSEPRPATPVDRNKPESVKVSTTKDTPTRISRAQPPPPPLKLLNAPISEPFVEDFPDLPSYDEMVPPSPITLDRSIFDWVNQNITQVTTTTTSATPQHLANPTNSFTLPPSSTIADASISGFDSLHIDPLVTLNKPHKYSSTNNMLPLVTPSSLQGLNFGIQPSYNSNPNNPATVLPGALPSMNLGHTSASGANKSLTIASASAANATSGALNLPPPSEVLAGFLDSDARGDGHAGVTGALLWDDLLN